MKMNLSITLAALILGASSITLTSCGTGADSESMEARMDRSVEEMEAGRVQLTDELLLLRNELDQHLLKVDAGLADETLTEEERLDHEALRAEVSTQHDRVVSALDELSNATVETWTTAKLNAEQVASSVESWVEQHGDNVLETVEDATEELDEETSAVEATEYQ